MKRAIAFFREEEIDKNFAKMEGMVVQWQRRIEAKNRTAEKEWEKKQRILAEVDDSPAPFILQLQKSDKIRKAINKSGCLDLF